MNRPKDNRQGKNKKTKNRVTTKQMTSYRVVAPLFLARFQQDNGVLFRAWSPRRYGPAYTYDIVIEGEDDQHPSMSLEYIGALQRVMDAVRLSEGFVDLTTDVHSPVPVEQRGETVYFVTLRDSLFSPVFFLQEDADLYLRHLWDLFLEWRDGFQVRSASHSVI